MKKVFMKAIAILLVGTMSIPSLSVYGFGLNVPAEDIYANSFANTQETDIDEKFAPNLNEDTTDISKDNEITDIEQNADSLAVEADVPLDEPDMDPADAIVVPDTPVPEDAYVEKNILPKGLIVKYKSDISEAAIQESSKRIKNEIRSTLAEKEIEWYGSDLPVADINDSNPVSTKSINFNRSSRLETLSVDDFSQPDMEISTLIEELEADPNIEYVQEDFALTPLSYPSDPHFSDQWGILNEGQIIGDSEGVIGADINITDIWDELDSSSEVTVALLDTGVDVEHLDLNDVFVDGYNFTDLYTSYIEPLDGNPHGTQVAGVIAARHNNTGIAGVAPNINIMPLKVIADKVGYTSDVISAIEYAKERNVRIINCSWGSTFYNRALYEVIAENPEMLFVCATGDMNGGQPVYPAAFGLPNILAVSAVDNTGAVDINASYADYVNLYAPGINIYSTSLGNSYEFVSGTSIAAGFVTGAAAIYLQYYPEAIGQDIAAAIRLSVCYRGEDTPIVPAEAGSNAPLLDIGAMLEVLPGEELLFELNDAPPLPYGFDLSDYYIPYEDQPEYIQGLMSVNPLYTDMSDEEKETLNY